MRLFRPRQVWRVKRLPLAFTWLCAVAWASAAHGVTHLQRGMDCPPLSLKGPDGAEVTNAALRGHAAILLFGEVYHEKTRQAWVTAAADLQDERLSGEQIVPVVITTKEGRPEERKAFAVGRAVPVLVCDADRQSFDAFRVTVMPSIVIVGRDGRVVQAIAGLVPRLGDILTDCLLYACGKLSEENLERSIKSVPTTQPSERDVRADRIAHLASQLARRGLSDMAVEKYREALDLNAAHPDARLGLAMLLLKQRRLPEAEAEFRKVLAGQPDSPRARLGLAYVQTLRGGANELDEAERATRAILARNPSNARAQYLLGLVFEKRNKPEEAAASFKKSSELFLDGAEQE